jgi:phosphoribosylformimino-5-aminoimidazole carboxamide ribotide isomerase
MIVVPAIDLRHGNVVRLVQGELRNETVYGNDPQEVARRWEAEGAERLHVVDLDAAIEGRPQPDVVGAVIDAVKIPVEVGGGLRVLEHADRYKERGAERLIFGTAAVARPGVVQEALKRWPDAVAVAIDARNGKVAVAGWQEVSTVEVMDLVAQVREWGVRRIQHTDVVRDGTLRGPNLPAIQELASVPELRITVAGGISTLDDLRRLSELEAPGVDEVVVGKALYEGRFTLFEAIQVLGGKEGGARS